MVLKSGGGPGSPIDTLAQPGHGGRLNAAVERWRIPRAQWLDLSTGINPTGWPIPAIPPEVWQRLPEADDGLETVIRQWAKFPSQAACLPVAGSQAAIQALPRLRPTGRVAVPVPGYREHGHCWAAAGHEVLPLGLEDIDAQLDRLDVVVWIQPNNPTGQVLPAATLLDWQARLAHRGGWLVIDEAFIGAPDVASLAAHSGREGLIVLRSLGKFFGLAGVRAGAVIAWPELAAQLDGCLGPWAVSGPARYLMAAALKDLAWQAATAERLLEQSERLRRLLTRYGLGPWGGSNLFQYCPHHDASGLADALARRGILARRFDSPPALRFGLPGPEPEWARLEDALAGLAISIDR